MASVLLTQAKDEIVKRANKKRVFMIDYQQIYLKSHLYFVHFLKWIRFKLIKIQKSYQLEPMEKHPYHRAYNTILCQRTIQMNEDIIQLCISLQKLQSQNRLIHRDILALNPHFNYQLYESKKQKNLPIEIQRQLMLKQIDTLLDQQSYLSQRKEQVILKKKFQKENRAKVIPQTHTQFNYSTLKKLFNSNNSSDIKSCQRADELNKIVLQIKNKINRQISIQQAHQKNVKSPIQKLYVPYRKYEELQFKCRELESQVAELQKVNANLKQQIKESKKQSGINKIQKTEKISKKKIQKEIKIKNSQIQMMVAQKNIRKEISFNFLNQFNHLNLRFQNQNISSQKNSTLKTITDREKRRNYQNKQNLDEQMNVRKIESFSELLIEQKKCSEANLQDTNCTEIKKESIKRKEKMIQKINK